MKKLLLFALSGIVLTSHAASPPLLTAEQWSVPRNAEAVLAMPAVAEAVRQLQAGPAGGLILRHPGGDEGTLWAHELRAWLVALGLPSAQIELVPGSHAAAIELDVVATPPGGRVAH